MALVAPDHLLRKIPRRKGHFQLESGYHALYWYELDLLFHEQPRSGVLGEALAKRLERYDCQVVCGPVTGGAFLALLVAKLLNVRFAYTLREAVAPSAELYQARYHLPLPLERLISGSRVVLVDDAISTGSAMRSTLEAILACGGKPVAAGTLIQFGDVGKTHLRRCDIKLESLVETQLQTWKPSACPMCKRGEPFEFVTDG